MTRGQHQEFHLNGDRAKAAYYAPKSFRRTSPGSADASKPSSASRWVVSIALVAAGFGAGHYWANRSALPSDMGELPGAARILPLNMPATGIIFKVPVPAGEVVAPFKISGAFENHCVVELYPWTGASTALLRVLVRSREAFETAIPLGRYKGTITCGSSWYGPAEFGADSTQDRIAAPLNFVQAANGQLQGMAIDLKRRAGGNLPVIGF